MSRGRFGERPARFTAIYGAPIRETADAITRHNAKPPTEEDRRKEEEHLEALHREVLSFAAVGAEDMEAHTRPDSEGWRAQQVHSGQAAPTMPPYG